MSKHGTARSKAGKDALSKREVGRYYAALRKQGAVLLRHPAVVRQVIKTPRKVGQVLRALILTQDPHAETRKRWEGFYQKYFGLTVDFSTVAIPQAPAEFSRLVFVAQGITLNTAMQACKKYFPTWQYCNDLDADVTEHDRSAQRGAYAVWFRDRVEADEETANKSADDLAAESIPGNTLLERMLMELDYFDRTGKHLDIENVTLCSGSRRRDGYVPYCYWHDGKFNVSWDIPGSAYSRLRARVAVS